MSTYERQFAVNDKGGRQFICTMKGMDVTIPRIFEDLSEQDRKNCILFPRESSFELSDFEE